LRFSNPWNGKGKQIITQRISGREENGFYNVGNILFKEMLPTL